MIARIINGKKKIFANFTPDIDVYSNVDLIGDYMNVPFTLFRRNNTVTMHNGRLGVGFTKYKNVEIASIPLGFRPTKELKFPIPGMANALLEIKKNW